MKVVQVPFCFHPDPVGGTEVYVEALAQELKQLGVHVVVAAPARGVASYTHNGLRVRRFAVDGEVEDLRELYGGGDSQATKGFATILDEEKPELVHLHAFTRGVSLRLMLEARQRGIPTAFTYHTPTVSCQRGTLMRWGRRPCDGVLRAARCAACTLHSRGAPRAFAAALGHLPSGIGAAVAAAGLRGGFWTALRMSELVRLRHGAIRDLLAEVDRIVVLCEWTRALLLRNGVPGEKIAFVRHALPSQVQAAQGRAPAWSTNTSPLRVVFLGRLEPAKGPDLLIRAVRKLPGLDVCVHIYGVVQSAADRAYKQQLRDLAGEDGRVRIHPAVPSEQVAALLRDYHVVGVPSRCFETGPLVVLEAFAAGVPVIGSDLGGIAELVQNEINGLLMRPDSVTAWAEALVRVVDEPGLLSRLRAGIRPPRPAHELAREMVEVYRGVFGRRPLLRLDPAGTS